MTSDDALTYIERCRLRFRVDEMMTHNIVRQYISVQWIAFFFMSQRFQ